MTRNDFMAKDDNAIVLRITPTTIERALFIILILILGYFTFFGDCDCEAPGEDNGIIDNVVTTVTTESTNALTDEITADATKTEVENNTPKTDTTAVPETTTEPEEIVENITVVVEPEPEPEPEPELPPLNGKITLGISKVYTELKGDGSYGVINKVIITVDNQKEEIEQPHFKVYTYDDYVSDIFTSKPREEKTYSVPVDVRDKKTYSIDVTSPQFTHLNEDVTVKVRFYDGNTFLKESTKLVTFSS